VIIVEGNRTSIGSIKELLPKSVKKKEREEKK